MTTNIHIAAHEDLFETWWDEHGQFLRAGGGEYEKTFAFHAWEKALEAAPALDAQGEAAWEGGEGWESLAWELCADEHGEEACNELIWEGGPIPEPWGDRWMKYEGEAKRLIALVHKHVPAAPAATESKPEQVAQDRG